VIGMEIEHGAARYFGASFDIRTEDHDRFLPAAVTAIW
jgi:hypothetical protein